MESENVSFNCVQLFVIPWTVAYKAPLSMRLSRQEYWSGLPFPSPGDLPNLGIEPGSPALHYFPGGSDSKVSAYNAGGLGLIPELGRSPGEGNGRPLQYPCLENLMDRGAL